MKKLKMNKLFQPCTVDVHDELYPNGIFVFNITKLQNFIEANKNKFPIEYVDVNSISKCNFSNINELSSTMLIAQPAVVVRLLPCCYLVGA